MIKYVKDYRSFINEKMSVLKREMYNDIDEFGISKIINNFMNNISLHPDKNYEVIEPIFDTLIEIKYRPTLNKNINGETRNRLIFIYTPYRKEKRLDIKYTLVHELTHMFHQILSNNERPFDDLDNVSRLRYVLLKNTIGEMFNHKDLQYLSYVLYMEDKIESLAQNQNAYMYAFKFKKENLDMSNGEIVSNVLSKMKMTTTHLSLSKRELKNEKKSFDFIIMLLVGNFFELGKSGFQQYFDKDIFKIPVVKHMREKLKEIINKNSLNFDNMVDETEQLILTHKSILEKYHEQITNSFINHMDYWFEYMLKRTGKAIQLGIEDATVK